MHEAIEPALWTSLVTVAGVWLVTVLSPGPNFLATVHMTLTRSRRDGLRVVAGIAVGTTIWATATLAGLGLLFQTTAWLYQLVKLAGAAYLIVLGLRLILTARRTGQAGGAAQGNATGDAFRRGLLTDLSNPKAAAFFTSLFAVSIPPTAPLWYDALVVAVVVAIAGGWYAAVALAIGLGRVSVLYRKAERGLAYLTGAVFMGLGVRLAADR